MRFTGTIWEARPEINLFGDTWVRESRPSSRSQGWTPKGLSFVRAAASKHRVWNCSRSNLLGVFRPLSNCIALFRDLLKRPTQISMIPAKLEALGGKNLHSSPLVEFWISGQSNFWSPSFRIFDPDTKLVPLSEKMSLGVFRVATKALKAFRKAAVVMAVTTSTLMKRVTRQLDIRIQHFLVVPFWTISKCPQKSRAI